LTINKKYPELLIISIFLILNIVIYSLSLDGGPLVAGADSGQYLRPAKSLIDYGYLSMNPPGFNPSTDEIKPFTVGTPIYSYFLAFFYYFFGQSEIFYKFVVFGQCLLLVMTGLISKKIFNFLYSKGGNLVLILVIFNPNSLTTAHLIQSETIFTFFLVSSMYFLFSFTKNQNYFNSLMISILVACTALTRPAGLYFAYSVPLIMLCASICSQLFIKKLSKRTFLELLKHIFLVFFLSSSIISIWQLRNLVHFGDFVLSTNSGAYLRDNYQTLLHRGRGNLSQTEIIEITNKKQLEYFHRKNISSECLNTDRNILCNKPIFDALKNEFFKESWLVHSKAFIHSWAVLYFSGGASNLRNYLGIEGNELLVNFQEKPFTGFDSIFTLVHKMNPEYFLIFVFFSSFAVLSRILGVMGLFNAFKNKENWPYLFIFLFVLLIFTAMYLYLGQSRFRVPLEPILMILTAMGIIIRNDK